MHISKIEGVKIEAMWGCVPEVEVDNNIAGVDLFNGSLNDLLKSTGIIKRRVCSEGVSSLDLCLKAGSELLKHGSYDLNDIGGVVCVTFTPASLMPNNSTYIQSKLGLSNDIPAFDINLACSGYPYGLWIASLMAKNLNKKILLLDGDKQSHITSPYDKSTALLFSDAGTATLISPTDSDTQWYFNFETDGSKRDVLIVEDGGSKSPFSDKSLRYIELDDGSKRRNIDITMKGMEVFKFVVQAVPANLKAFMQELNLTSDFFDFLILHQANVYMIKQVCKKVGIPLDRLPITADIYGNSSSATIPITIASTLSNEIKSRKLSLIISGFGAGLSISCAAIELEKNTSLGVVEYEP